MEAVNGKLYTVNTSKYGSVDMPSLAPALKMAKKMLSHMLNG